MQHKVTAFRPRVTERLFIPISALLLSAGLLALMVVPSTAQKPPQNNKPAVTTPIASKMPSKVASEGQYTDRTNQKHTWQINTAHALIWDNRPYVPVGAKIIPKSLAKADEVAWQSDQADITAMKSRGLQDILIAPDRPLADVDPKSLQRLIDYLEASGLRYGITFGPGIQKQVSGYVVKPTVYRLDARPSPIADPLLTGEWVATDSDSGVVFFYDGGNESAIFRAFKIKVTDGIASVPIETPPAISHPFVLLLPHKTLSRSDKGTLPDIWSEFDRYRDRTLTVASQIKWGPGLRFFLDPLVSHLGLSGEAPFLVPESMHFRLEWESFLTRKYGTTEAIRAKWGLMPRVNTIAELARLIPLWAYGRGCPAFYDADSQQMFRLMEGNQSATNSAWWNDFQAFRDNSISYYMNSMADVLKRQVANVPVVYTWTANGGFFTNYQPQGGFDGLALATHIGETARLSRVVGPAYSQAEQSQRTTWFLASELMGPEPSATVARPGGAILVRTTDATAPPVPATPTPTFTKTLFARDLDDLRRTGSKGFFIDSIPGNEAPKTNGTSDMFGWLGDYATTLRTDTNVATLRPPVLFYPQGAPGPAQTGYVPGTPNVLWLPGAYYGENIDLWPFCWGYNIRREFDDAMSTVLVTYQGPQKAHFAVLNPMTVRAYTPEGKPVSVKVINKTQVEIILDKTPTIIQFGSDVSPVPEEAATNAYVQLTLLHEIAKLQKVFGAETSTLAIDRAKDFIVKKNFNQAYIYARAELDKLVAEAAPYIWLEGEQDKLLESKAPLFNEIAGHPEASNGVYLRLATPNRPHPVYGYKARYEFTANRDGMYQIWLAGSLAGPNTSPIKWNIDNSTDRDISEPNVHGSPYMNERFGWMLLGNMKLTKGNHQLTIDVTDPAVATHEYAFAIDALMVTDKPFTPNGVVRPLPVDDLTARDISKQLKSLNPPAPHVIP